MSRHGTVSTPCAHCPFRSDVPIYLRRERREQIRDSIVLEDQTFHCHETVTHREDDDGEEYADTYNSRGCAGAAKAVLQAGGMGQMLRIEERLGITDPSKLEANPIPVWDLDEWVRVKEGSTADDFEYEEGFEDVETCCVVESGCLAPAGFMGPGGGIVHGTVAADGWCDSCGEAVCSNCRHGDDGPCYNCQEPDSDDEWW